MTHITLKPGDEIRAGDEYLHPDDSWLPCRATIGTIVTDSANACFRRPTPDQPQEATETQEANKVRDQILEHYVAYGVTNETAQQTGLHAYRWLKKFEAQRDAAQAEIARLKEDLDCWLSNAKGLQKQVNEWEPERAKDKTRIAQLESDLLALRASTVPRDGILKYVKHKMNCASWFSGSCDCGLSDALSATPTDAKE